MKLVVCVLLFCLLGCSNNEKEKKAQSKVTFSSYCFYTLSGRLCLGSSLKDFKEDFKGTLWKWEEHNNFFYYSAYDTIKPQESYDLFLKYSFYFNNDSLHHFNIYYKSRIDYYQDMKGYLKEKVFQEFAGANLNDSFKVLRDNTLININTHKYIKKDSFKELRFIVKPLESPVDSGSMP